MPLVQLSEEQSIRLSSYLSTELSHHRAERAELEDRWIREALDFWAEPNPDPQQLPVVGFASLIVPLTSIAVEAVHARVMGMLYGLKELVTVEVPDQFSNLKHGLEKVFNHELLESVQFRAKTESAILELEKHGTGIIAVGYRETKRGAVLDANGNRIKVPIYLEKGTCIDTIPIKDFLMPFYALSCESAPWVGYDFRYTERQIRQAEATGWFYPGTTEKLRFHYTPSDVDKDKVQSLHEDLTNTDPVFPQDVRLSRIFVDFQLDEGGDFGHYEVIFHDQSNIICHVSYAEDRPFEKGVYLPLENRWYGYGIAKQNHEFQVEVTTQHRQRIDNATIANMSMFKVKESARQWIKDDEPIFPGKKWYVQDMDDIMPLPMGDVKVSSYNNENQAVIYSQQRTGINELTLGMPNIGTPGTASDSMARVQESNRRFDYTYNNIKDFLNRVVHRAAQSIIKYGFRDTVIFEYVPNGPEIQTFLLQKERLKNKMFFNIQLTSARANKVLDRNTYTQLMGMQVQYWSQMLQLIQVMGPEAMNAATEQAIFAANEVNLAILQAFDIPNPEKLIVDLDSIRQAAAQRASQMAPPTPGQAPPEGIQGNGGIPPELAALQGQLAGNLPFAG
jgi:hypothetical protein